MHQIYPHVLSRMRDGSSAALATVIRTTGSTPQKPGSSALFDKDGLVTGTVGGGLLEGEIARTCEEALLSGISDHYSFVLDSEQGSDGAICGGAATVLVDARPGQHQEAFQAMEESLAASEGGWLFTSISRRNHTGRLIRRFWIPYSQRTQIPQRFPDELKQLLGKKANALSDDLFLEIDLGDTPSSEWEILFAEPVKPLPRLIIAGAGHVGKALAHLGKLLDFDVTVIDDRPDLANPMQIPDASHFRTDPFPEAISKIQPDPETYIVIVTRGHQYDSDVLLSCIDSPAAYIGMIGSKTKVAHMRKKYLKNGWATPETWAKVHTPIGLPIGSQTVQEIAVSIAAQLIQIRSRKKASREN